MGNRQTGMRSRQTGVSLGGLMVGSVIVIVIALVGMKMFPVYLNFFSAKKAIIAVGQERAGASVSDIRKAFDNRAAIDDIRHITGADLEITKEGGEVLISFAYRSETPMFSNIGIYIDFAAQSKE